MEEIEIWLPIKEFDHYEISNWGRVRSLKHYRPKPLKQRLSNKGYKTVGLSRPGRSPRNLLVHRLVAMAFIPNPENKPHVNHLYGMIWDNRASQLCWATRSENQLHALATGLRKTYTGENNKMTTIPDKIVLEIVKSSSSDAEIAKMYNISKGYVNQIRGGRARSETTGIEWGHPTKQDPSTILSVFKANGKAKDIAAKYGVKLWLVYGIKSGKYGRKITGLPKLE